MVPQLAFGSFSMNVLKKQAEKTTKAIVSSMYLVTWSKQKILVLVFNNIADHRVTKER